MQGTVPDSEKAAVSKTDKNPGPIGIYIYVFFLGKMKSGTISSGFNKGSNRYSPPFFSPRPIPFFGNPYRTSDLEVTEVPKAQGCGIPEQRSKGFASLVLCCIPSIQNSTCTELARNKYLLNAFHNLGLRTITEIPRKEKSVKLELVFAH